MLFPYKQVLHAYLGDLDDKKHLEEVGRRLLGDAYLEPGRLEILQSFLKDGLPPPTKQTKIIDRLGRTVRENGAKVREFFWWDIPSGQHLIVDLERSGRRMHILLLWKKTDKKATQEMNPSFVKQGWALDREAPGGFRYELEGHAYQHVRAAFEQWMATPLPNNIPLRRKPTPSVSVTEP
jgi:hypothetical protein